MKITVINGTQKQGVTYKLKEIFLDELRDKAEITEFYLPKDCPGFCLGCTACFLEDENKCKDREYVAKIEESMLAADLLVFATPTYVYHATGAMKAMLDHFGYRWMVHRPAKEFFGKRAFIITQSIGSGEKSAAQDIKDSLSWWGVSDIRQCGFKLMSGIFWDKLPEGKRASMTASLRKAAAHYKNIDYSKPARTSISTKAKFYAARFVQNRVKKSDQRGTDYRYWEELGWIESGRPWK